MNLPISLLKDRSVVCARQKCVQDQCVVDYSHKDYVCIASLNNQPKNSLDLSLSQQILLGIVLNGMFFRSRV